MSISSEVFLGPATAHCANRIYSNPRSFPVPQLVLRCIFCDILMSLRIIYYACLVQVRAGRLAFPCLFSSLRRPPRRQPRSPFARSQPFGDEPRGSPPPRLSFPESTDPLLLMRSCRGRRPPSSSRGTTACWRCVVAGLMACDAYYSCKPAGLSVGSLLSGLCRFCVGNL